MDTEKCKVLMKVIEKGSLSAAAEELGFTPSGVGYMIDAVEAELGLKLLNRTHAGVSLTPNGRRLQPLLSELADVETRLKDQATELRTLISGEITIGVFASISNQLMPFVLADLSEEHPDIAVRIIEGTQEELEKLIRNNGVELAICCKTAGFECSWIPLRKDEMMIAVPKGHPLAKFESISPHQLDGIPMIMPGNGSDPANLELISRFGIDAFIKYTTVEHISAFSMVGHGLGVCITNELLARGNLRNSVLLPFNPGQYIEEGIVMTAGHKPSPIAKRLIKKIKEHIKDIEID